MGSGTRGPPRWDRRDGVLGSNAGRKPGANAEGIVRRPCGRWRSRRRRRRARRRVSRLGHGPRRSRRLRLRDERQDVAAGPWRAPIPAELPIRPRSAAVRERDLLLRNAPGLVHPLPFLIPAYADHGPSRTALRFGLFLYDLLSKEKTLPRRSWLSAEEAREREPRIAEQGLAGAGLYYDAWTDDSRLVLAIVQDAAAAGAIVANHVEVEGLVRQGGRVAGARLRDSIAGASFGVSARFAVNATGVWLDHVRNTRRRPTIRPTKGIHIFVPRAKIGNRCALALSAKRDGRIVFVLAWGALTLVGTTDTDFRGDPD